MSEKKTPFFDFEKETSAHFTGFAGWKLPLHFGSAINEAQKIRYDVGFFDISHMGRVKVFGQDSLKLFQKIFTRKLKQNLKGFYGFLVSEEGKVIDDAIIFRKTETEIIAVLNSARKDRDIELMRYEVEKNGFSVEIKDISGETFFIAIQGTKSFGKMKEFLSNFCHRIGIDDFSSNLDQLKRFSFFEEKGIFVSRTGYTGEDGFEFYAPAVFADIAWDILDELSVQPCGLAARDILRLEAGFILYGADLTEEDTVFFSHLEKFVEPDFERYELMRKFAEKNPTYLRGVVWDNFPIPSHGDKTEPDGFVTSSVFSPILRKPISFVRFKLPVEPGTSVKVFTKNKLNTGYVSHLPFIKKS